ncbi:hypothetical protein [Acinetobacter lwoffii]|uniref:hypothetical protein n=1 Tax=Acinetobacter lwoffii TaxID=28090 RepID=UPI002DBE4F07|nr:hypothetical protein [Acinetobacter lwoffii]MEB6680153.1 hypothetical protein [Acinetobacter lwoffii]
MKIALEDYKAVFMALMAFFSVYPYFIWGYYGVVIFFVFFLYLVSLLILFKNINTSNSRIVMFLVVFLLYIIFNINHLDYSSFIWAVVIAFFTSSSNVEIVKTFYLFKKIIVYTLLPGAILWFLHILWGNNSLFYLYEIQPFNPVKLEYQISFYSYVFSLIPNYDVPSSFYRFCGIFEEPGVVGTVCSLLLVADKCKFKSYENKLLLFYGVISFSLAFYVIILLYFLIFMVRSIKGLFLFLFFSFGLFLLYSFSAKFEELILSRLAFSSDSGFSGNNRSSIYLDNLFKNWFKSEVDIILFGYPNVINDGYSSIKQVPVENGLLGVFSAFCFLALIIYKNSISGISGYNLFFIFFIFFISLFQRPSFYILYFILILSFAFLNHSNFLKSRTL